MCVEIEVFRCVCGGRCVCMSVEIDVFVCEFVWRLMCVFACVWGN